MKKIITYLFSFSFILLMSSCVSNKKFNNMKSDMQSQLDVANKQLGKCGEDLNKYMGLYNDCSQDLAKSKTTLSLREEQVGDLKEQVADYKKTRDRQVEQVGDLTVLSQAATENINKTLAQLEKKDKYIHLLQAAKTKADSINLVLSVNLKSVLKDGIEDQDVDIKVDKTVVFINLSDKMLYQSGSSNLTSKAKDVLGKIAKIIESKKDIEVMVEGYTDNVPIKSSCIDDNWDLSVKRATSVVRVLQKDYGVNPDKLIAAGRGEYNTLASNDTAEGRSTNRRTRIIIMPKLNQFYDLLNPENIEK